ncbi:MAG: oxidoreductase [Planctomycetales bacterium 12-60-4]|nr:MAG: oxidoreductase [Planctomycetales bacterium 12-60-4]
MDLQLTGRVAIVTGAASGIGLATVRGLLHEGCRVACWDVAANLPDVVGTLLTDHPGNVAAVHCDITEESAVRNAVTVTEQTFGGFQHLVHAAATGSGKFGFPFTNVPADAWRRVYEVNVQGMVHVAQATAPRLRDQRDGTMLFVSSVAGQIGSQTDPPYSASKAANINFAQCLAKDLAPFGVRVNTVCPGMVQTPLNRAVWQAWHDQQPPERQRSYEDWADEKVRTVVPLGRWQRPEDIADMIVFLSSARAREVTGQTINVDGGFVMHW